MRIPTGSLPISEALYYYQQTHRLYAADCEKIGVIIPTAINPAYPDMADKLSARRRRRPWRLFVMHKPLAAGGRLSLVLLDANVSGIVAIPVCDDSHELYIEANPPVILYGCRTPEESLGYIAMDDILAGRIAAEHLMPRDSQARFSLLPARSYAVATD
jgi:DNA-binding LacI/PurR family transcriptional regulator